MYNILIGGKAGQGIDTATAILEKLLKRGGYSVFTTRDFMSRVRGGHNFSLIRFDINQVRSHSDILDGIIALDQETIRIHSKQLKENGFILCDSELSIDDPREIIVAINDIATELGNPRVAGSVSIGIILKLFGENLKHVKDVFQSFLKEKYLEINVQAIQKGYDSVEQRYDHLDGHFSRDMIISGSSAIALGAIAAGIRTYFAYPMSPSTPIMVYLASKADEAGIVVEQAEDEIAAINMALGASYAGARTMTGTSGGGFSLMVEALGLSGIAEIPIVIVDVQRPGPATGLPTRTEQADLKFVISAAQGEFPRLVIAPKDQEDAFYQTVRAFDLAEKYQIPVIILADQFLGDGSATVKPFDLLMRKVNKTKYDYDKKDEYLRYKDTETGISPRLIPGKSKELVRVDSDEHDEKGWITESDKIRTMMVDKRMKKLRLLIEELQEPEMFGLENFDTLLLCWGSLSGAVKEAVAILNNENERSYAALIFSDVFPLPQKLLMQKANEADHIINIEQNSTGQFAGLVREHTGIICTRHILKYDGRQITGKEIAIRIQEEMKQ